jgi:hypothetical protein
VTSSWTSISQSLAEQTQALSNKHRPCIITTLVVVLHTSLVVTIKFAEKQISNF